MRQQIRGGDRVLVRVIMLSIVLLVCMGSSAAARNVAWGCLPEGIKPADVVSTMVVRAPRGGREIRKTTVEQTLKGLQARCTKKRLVDASGTEIRFYRLTGCSGTASPEDREIRERQSRELAELKKRYRVIEMTCNPSGENIPRSISQVIPNARGRRRSCAS